MFYMKLKINYKCICVYHCVTIYMILSSMNKRNIEYNILDCSQNLKFLFHAFLNV
jgi:hypothetical protein